MQHDQIHIDEIYTLSASDPSNSYLYIINNFFLRESNPPGYYSAAYVVRHFITDYRIAFIAVNSLFLLATIIYVLFTSQKLATSYGICIFFILFLTSGAALAYFQIGRAYFGAMCIVACLWWFTFSLILVPQTYSFRPFFEAITLGSVASQLHVYSAIFAIVIATFIAIIGLLTRRGALLSQGIVLGFAACTSFGLWWLFVVPDPDRVEWLDFSADTLRWNFSMLRAITFGTGAAAYLLILPIAVFVCWLLIRGRPDTRIIWLFCGVCLAIFILPVAVSVFYPIIFWRYWGIYIPSIIGFIGYFSYQNIVQRTSSANEFREKYDFLFSEILSYVVLGAIVLSSISSLPFVVARTEGDIGMPGQEYANIMKECPEHSIIYKADMIHINSVSSALGIKRDTFANPDDIGTIDLAGRRALCRVVGYVDSWSLSGLSKSEIFKMIGVTDDKYFDKLDVVRYWNGALVVRR